MSGSEAASSRSGWRDDWLTLGLVGVTATSVLTVGGVHAATQVALSAATLVFVAGYGVARGVRGLRLVPFSGVLAIAVGATALQLVPLPAPIVAFLSPRAYELRQAVTPDARLMPLTLDVPATWLALVRGASCLGLLLLSDGLARVRRLGRRVLWLLALLGAGTAVIALSQRLVGARQILGVYTPRGTPGGGFFGPFVDVNHCASVLALGTLVAAGFAVERRGRQRAVLTGLALVSGVALLYSGSRGGLAGFAVGGTLLLVILASRRVGFVRAGLAALVLLAVGVSATLWMHEGLRARTIDAPSQLWSNQKVRGWSDGLRMAGDFRWTGVGRGAFEAPVNAYRPADEGVRLVYPEDLVVQLVSELGFPVALLLIGLALSRAARLAPSVARLPPGAVGAACAVVAVVLHELVDFGLELPGVAFPTVVALGAVTGYVAADDRQRVRPRSLRVFPVRAIPLGVAWLLALVAAAWSSRHTLDRDWDRLHAADDPAALQAAMARHPADDYLPLVGAQRAMRDGRPDAMRFLNRALTLHPSNWQAHRMAARLLAAWKRPAQAALEYRLASQAGPVVEIDELVRVLGPHVVEAVPQTTAALQQLAHALYVHGRPVEADAAAARAADVSDARETALERRAELALEFNKAPQLVAAGKALLAEATAPESFVLAARALAAGGDRAGADKAIDAGLEVHPREAQIFVDGARLRAAAGDYAGARALLARVGKLTALSLEDRLHAEELLADVADKQGDSATALVARARSRMISQEIRDMSFSHGSK